MEYPTHPPKNLHGAVMRALAPHWGALLAVALFLIAGLAVLDRYGITGDENLQRQAVEANLGYLADGDTRAFTSALPADVDKFYGMAFEAPLLLAERAFDVDDNPRAIHLTRHLHKRLLFLVGGLFAYLLARRVFGSRLLAVGAMLLFLLHPRLYAHSFFNPKDIPFLATFMIALFLAHRAFKRDNVSAFVLLGVGVGLLVNLRIMGIVLLAGVPSLRALDFALASGWAERKRVLLTTGGFALAGALTIYALLPYLWADPIPRAVEAWTTLSNHPVIAPELFRGKVYLNIDFPIEYLPVWFSITSPPFALLLGGIGGAAILAAAARAPRKALRSGGLRFGLLAVGCFAAPVAGALLLDSNMYDGWRQMYFLWAPFSLLAMYGLRFLASGLRRLRTRALTYGAAGAGFAGVVISMGLIHPNQQVYFNFLVDRVTPERLRSQYDMDYYGHSGRQALEWSSINGAARQPGQSAIDGNYPAGILSQTLALPESARERLAEAAPFDVVPSDPRMSWSRSARELHRVEAYGNALMIIESRDDPREVYKAVRGREPVRDGAFGVHRIDGALALMMEPCAPVFVERVSVVLRAFPVDPGDLPAWREGKTFEPRRFHLSRYDAYFEGKCAASLPLPAYPIADFELRWSLELLDEAEAREKARRAREEGRLLTRAAHRSAYDIYLADGELAYLNDSCDPEETEHTFHLNAHPERVGDLPEERRERGFERFHFEFLTNGAFVDGGCAAFFPLPDYPVAAVNTGQNDAEGTNLWFAKFWIDPERRWAEAAAGALGEPVARGAFDVHMADGALVYVKEACESADTDARFFLHVVPDRAEDLPDDRRRYGFDNLDFAFFPNGALFEGSCAARIPLPDYPVAGVRTGQRDREGGVLWSAEFWIDPGRRWADAAAGASGEPVAGGAFDVYAADGALVYVKEPCDEADAEARFFLHVVPERGEDLPDDRREYGFDTLGFAFFSNGALFEGSCAARVPLPAYAVASIRTGQYVSGVGEIWSAEFAVGK